MIAPNNRQPLKGGLGGGAPGPLIPEPQVPSRTEASEVKLVGAAVRQKWNVPDVVLERLPTQIARIAADERREDRARIAAAKVLVQMVAQNNTPEATGGTHVTVGVQVNNQQGDDPFD